MQRLVGWQWCQPPAVAFTAKKRPTRLQVLQTLSRKANTEKKKEKDPKKIWQLQPKSYDSKYSNVPMQTFLRYTYYVILIHSTANLKLHIT